MKGVLDTTEYGQPGISLETTLETSSGQAFGIVNPPDFGPTYEVLELLGSGRMGSVFKVNDTASGATVAIKVLQCELAKDTAAQKRFEQEVEAASRLDHPNLVAVYGHGRTKCGMPFMIMEYLDGKNLDQIIKEEGCIEPSRAIDLLIQIVEGLECAHNHGIIHRDIKPTNVIVCKGDSGEIAKLLDFGIAMVLPTVSRETRDLTQTGEIFGSPQYMSPEHCLGFMTDQRSDIYSFGCLLYAVLLGKPPFQGATAIQQIVGHINQEPKPFPFSMTSKKTLRMLERITMCCLEKEQAKRFPDSSELLKELRLVRNGKSVPYRMKIRTNQLTLEQLVAIVLWVPLFQHLFSFVPADLFNNTTTVTIPPALGTSFVETMLIGFAAFTGYRFFKEKRKIKDQKATESHWWKLFMLAVGTLVLLTECWSIWVNIYLRKTMLTLPESVLAISFFERILQDCLIGVLLIAAMFLLVSGANPKRVRFSVVLSRTLVTLALVASAVCLLPKVQARVLGIFAARAEVPFPDLAIALYHNCDLLDPVKDARLYGEYSPRNRMIFVQEKNGRIADAIESLNVIIERTTGINKIHAYLMRARLYIKIGQLEKAKEDLNALLKEHPSIPDASCWLGIIQSIKGDLDGALACYEKSLQIDPSFNNEAQYFRIGTLCRFKRYDQALEYTENVKKRFNFEGYGWFLQGLIHQQMGESTKANSDFRQVCSLLAKLDKKNKLTAEAELYLTYAYYQIGDMANYKERAQKYIKEYDLDDLDDLKYRALSEAALTQYSGMKLNW